MGTPSYVEYSEVKVIPRKLEQLKELLEQKKPEAYYDLIELQGDEVKFEGLNGCKIISYWYKEFCRFLKEIAKYMEGYVELFCADPNEGPAKLVFKKGKVTIEIRSREWESCSPEDLIKEKR